MANSFSRLITYDGDNIDLQVVIDNEGWSDLKPVLGYSSLRSSRCPRPLTIQVPSEGVITEDMVTFKFKQVQIRLSSPTFDLGLGCFGHPTKIVETGRGELTEGPGWWTIHHKTARNDISSGQSLLGRSGDLEATPPKSENSPNIRISEREDPISNVSCLFSLPLIDSDGGFLSLIARHALLKISGFE
ncbi:hypothetical protein F5Y14DRAFT_447097 [Nemania sp. NC0429]|nr:hypothetical protein F5Y14DRAFT_447097 [Nemania sp. NC0429]